MFVYFFKENYLQHRLLTALSAHDQQGALLRSSSSEFRTFFRLTDFVFELLLLFIHFVFARKEVEDLHPILCAVMFFGCLVHNSLRYIFLRFYFLILFSKKKTSIL